LADTIGRAGILIELVKAVFPWSLDGDNSKISKE
jgi:hypothetical protein